MENLTSIEFLERVKSSQKEFNDIYMQYVDLSGHEIRDITIRNSKFFFVTMRNCTFRNVTFEGCEFFFASFNQSEFVRIKFINCKIEYSGLSESLFVDSEMRDVKLAWTGLVNSSTSDMKMINCTEFKVFRNVEDLSPADIEKGFADLQPMLQHLDFDMRQKVLKILETSSIRYNTNFSPNMMHDENKYNKKSGSYESGKKGYNMFDSLIDTAISTYGAKPAYKSGKDAYETKGEYKK